MYLHVLNFQPITGKINVEWKKKNIYHFYIQIGNMQKLIISYKIQFVGTISEYYK